MPRRALPLAAILLLSACAQKYALQPERPGYMARARCTIDNAFGSHCGDQKVHPGLVGAAANWSSTSVKQSGEAAMHAEALRTGRAIPKASLEVLAYRTDAEHRNGEIVVNADILLYGRTPQVPDVVHATQLVAANGEVASTTPQLFKIDQVDGAGHYRAVSRYPIPPGTQAGVYTIRSAVLVGGAQRGTRATHFRVHP